MADGCGGVRAARNANEACLIQDQVVRSGSKGKPRRATVTVEALRVTLRGDRVRDHLLGIEPQNREGVVRDRPIRPNALCRQRPCQEQHGQQRSDKNANSDPALKGRSSFEEPP